MSYSPPQRQISNRTREQITSAVGRVVQLHDEGLSPTDALVKVAREQDLTPNLAKIVGRGFNIGQARVVNESGNSVMEKTAAVPLVDLDAAAARIVTPIEEPTQAKVASIYQTSPAVKPEQVKVAAAKPAVPQPAKPAAAKPTPRDMPWENPEAYNALELTQAKIALCRFLKEAKDNDRRYSERMSREMGRAIESFRQQNGPMYEECVTLGGDLVKDARDKYGELGATIANKLVGRVCDEKGWQKSAADVLGSEVRSSPKGTAPGLEKVAEIVKMCQDFDKHERQTFFDVIMGRAKLAELDYYTGSCGYNGMRCKTASADFRLGSSNPVAARKAYFQKIAAGAQALLGSLLGGAMNSKNKVDASDWRMRQAQLGLADPSLEQELDNVNTRTSLQILLQDDPVLRSYDPSEVISAYNELSRAAPTLVQNPVALQANLRRLVQGNLGTHEAGQMIDQEKKVITPAAPTL